MKPPVFEYAAPHSVAEVLELLSDAPEESSVLAGGQSLVPLLNMRMAQPRIVVDLNRVGGLDGVERTPEGAMRVGAMVRQLRLETDPELRQRFPLLREAARHVAHVAIRSRGTVGGSLAHADPAAELPAAFAALGGRMIIQGAEGARTVPATEFFLGPLTSALETGELLVGVEAEAPPPGTGWAFLEVARTHGAFALAGVAALLGTDSNGRIGFARLAVAGVDAVPYLPDWLDEAVIGEPPAESLFRRVGERVRAEVTPFDDIHASAEYRKHVAGVLTLRALSEAARRSGSEEKS